MNYDFQQKVQNYQDAQNISNAIKNAKPGEKGKTGGALVGAKLGLMSGGPLGAIFGFGIGLFVGALIDG